MDELTADHKAQIIDLYASAEFEKFQNAVLSTGEESNSQSRSSAKFDLSNVLDSKTAGSIGFRDCCFDFKLDLGSGTDVKSDIVYRFRYISPAQHTDNGSEHGISSELHSDLPGDPRNTPWMRYESEIVGSGSEPGQFAFYWDGEATEELAESLLREFVEWVQ